jgi:hypothetical protein
MTGRSMIAARQERTLKRIREILERHHPEAGPRLDVYTRNGVVPNSFKMNAEFHLYTAESVQMLAELVDGLLEASKPRPRGRPRKQEAS